MDKSRILITSVGSLVGWTILAALRPLRSRLILIGCNTVATSPTIYDCDRAYRVPETADMPAYRNRLLDIVQRERPHLIIPGRDEELGILGELSGHPAWQGIRVLAPPPALVPVFNDKRETARFAAREGLPFAATACTEEEIAALVESCGFPLVVKPRFGGHASKGVRIVADGGQLRAARNLGDMLAQECLAPETISATGDFLPGAGTPLQFAVRDLRHAAEWLTDDNGRVISMQGVVSQTEGPLSVHMRLTDDPALLEVAGDYARALAKASHRGVANIQGKRLADGRFVPFELNGRFTGSAGARALMGRNQIARAVYQFVWREAYPENLSQPDITTLRTVVYRGVEQTVLDAFTETGVWTAHPAGGNQP